MSLLEAIMGAQGGRGQDALAQRFDLSQSQVSDALGQLVPALNAGLKRNTESQTGVDSLLGALTQGNHERFLDQPETLTDESTTQEGNAILGHIFGSKEVSRQVAARASAKTGIDTSILKRMLPIAATMVMGSLSKQRSNLHQGGSSSGGFLTSLLDADGDGSIADDVMGMFKKLF